MRLVILGSRGLVVCWAIVASACSARTAPHSTPTVVMRAAQHAPAPEGDAPAPEGDAPAPAPEGDAPAPAPEGDAPTTERHPHRVEAQPLRYVYKTIYGVVGRAHPAFETAKRAFGQATAAAGAQLDSEAAALFLVCAAEYRAVPDEPAGRRATADENARVCYYDAIHAYANAGELAERGRAALVDAAAADPRMRSYVEELLADPPHESKRSGQR